MEPFPHIYIENIFNIDDFKKIISDSSICTTPSKNDSELFQNLYQMGYKIIDFPGCITSEREYLDWHKDKKLSKITNTSCESFGLTLRLMSPESEILKQVKSFIESEEFIASLARKFDINLDDVRADNGIQKYLDGYEISPHPDVRKKALTYMVNINPHPDSEDLNHHTHYLNLKDKYKYIKSFWEGNPDVERCWVPWDWCESKFIQNQNNSLVMFSPNSKTMHAVKANYNHLNGQRTQLYGNLWYERNQTLSKLEWEDLHISSERKIKNAKLTNLDFLSKIPSKLGSRIKNLINTDDLRNYEKIERKPDDYK